MFGTVTLIPDHFKSCTIEDFCNEHFKFLRNEKTRIQLMKEKISELELKPQNYGFLYSSKSCSDIVELYEPIVPKRSILATKSSRLRANEYKNDLLKQIEDKKNREQQAKEREKLEDIKREKTYQQQRLKIIKEFLEEQERLKEKKIKDKSIAVTESIQKSIRNPTFKGYKVDSPLSHNKLSKESNEFNLITDENKSEQAIHTNNLCNIVKSNIYDDCQQINAKDEKNDIKESQISVIYSKTGILSRLSEVRKKMQEDHKKMVEQLEKMENI